ncbi:putative camp-mediated signaling protein Sok1 [Talaromyces proteolyticus]|uniref:Camp-mediated signaling protein Sok1 n=1 Tax=Talaromyces proteolyticus TaxID=1131652 RepID=A0AAD4KQM5_9EURO|nr:putative camp-mediated signaling protein Sok1 [Talaromyces proteolyticus]KAH8697190.1 putative camp-mediated signaling protein Sok1 [Talaromyces proteolyticus]
MRIPQGMVLDCHQISRLRCAELLPPVTKETLSELDLERIMRNIHLRTDANFEPDLHFKPDLDGEKGRKKRKIADDYWEALLVEIMIYAYVNMNGSQTDDISLVQIPDSEILKEGLFRPRLPMMFETLQEILKTLVPERDHASVTENLDVSLLMQQVRKGVLDLPNLSSWLAALLKTHCAPMRDQNADEMVSHISEGSASQDMAKVAMGLRTLFGILEMMKLDVANHQIRAFRLILIEDTVPFLQDYFCRQITSRELKIEGTKAWYQDGQKRIADLPKEFATRKFSPVAVLLRGLCELLLQGDDDVKFPQAFQFDNHRLWQLRTEVQNLINIHVCWSIFESMVTNTPYGHSYTRSHLLSTFMMRISALLNEIDVSSNQGPKLGTRLPNDASIAVEMARLVCEVNRSTGEVSDEALSTVETALKKSFTEDSFTFRLVQNCVRQQLQHTTYELAQRYISMSPLEICESQRARQLLRSQPSDLGYIATKLAHIGVLHWRVWAPLVYMAETP